MQDRTANHAPGRPDEPLRELLAAVLEALDLPYPATVGDSETHDRILIERVGHAKIALQTVLVDDAPLGIEWTTEYLRERLASHPPTGYVTYDQARASLAEGKPWAEAVRPEGGLAFSSTGGEGSAPSFGPTAVQNAHDDAPTPYAVVRLDYQVSREELFAALVLGFTEANPDRDPDALSVAEVRSHVEAALAGFTFSDVETMAERLRAGAFRGEQADRLAALERAMNRAYPLRTAGGEPR